MIIIWLNKPPIYGVCLMERTCVSCAPINNSVRQFVAWEKQGRQRVLGFFAPGKMETLHRV
jgi:hypothetical protein